MRLRAANPSFQVTTASRCGAALASTAGGRGAAFTPLQRSETGRQEISPLAAGNRSGLKAALRGRWAEAARASRAGRHGLTLVECLVYITVLFIVLGIAGTALYQGMKRS